MYSAPGAPSQHGLLYPNNLYKMSVAPCLVKVSISDLICVANIRYSQQHPNEVLLFSAGVLPLLAHSVY